MILVSGIEWGNIVMIILFGVLGVVFLVIL